jgi:flagellum-specific peptidoglycan hydrolase FlgJ
MKRFLVVFFIGLTVCSCGSRKVVTRKTTPKPKPRVVIEKQKPKQRPEVIKPHTSLSATELYIETYKAIAQNEMTLYKIPASITLAQGILESASGKGRLSVKANNHFGIKCHNWTGAKIYHDDDKKGECFRKYNHAKYSFRDHSVFLSGRKRYAALFNLSISNYKGWAKGLRAAGYATDPKYPQKLIALIERYQLYTYDDEVLGGRIPKRDVKVKPIATAVVHVVKKGDTLYGLSKRYNTTVEQLQKQNNISGTALSLGQVLKIK